jgi:ABC-2 type transport system permease protein
MQPAGEMLPQAPVEGGRYGEVFDRGYKHYDGPRLGRNHARRALVGYSVKRAMGIKKSWTAKVIPIFLYIAALMPVIISLGIRAFLPSAEVLAYYDYFGFIFLVQGVFAAMIAPELLCSDRQEKVLPLYFARAISRADYLVAKLTAAALLMLTMSLAPAAILWLGRQLLDDRPLRAMSDNIGDLGRLTIGGVLISFYLGSLALMIASFTSRKLISIAVTIVCLLIATSLALALAVVIDNESARFLSFLSPIFTIDGLSGALFNQVGDNAPFSDNGYLPLWQYVVGMLAIILAALGIMTWRYLPND